MGNRNSTRVLGTVTLTLLITAMFVVLALPALAHHSDIAFEPGCLESDGSFGFGYTITAETSIGSPPEDMQNPSVEVWISFDGGPAVLDQTGAFVWDGTPGVYPSFAGTATAPAGTSTVTIKADPTAAWSDGTGSGGDDRTETFNAPTELCPPPPPPPPPPALGAIGELVWLDANADGYQGDFEAGVAGVTVNLLNSGGSVIATTATDSSGKYLFTGLVEGTYEVQFILPAGFEVSPLRTAVVALDSDAGVAGRTGAITLPSGVTDLTWDAGIFEAPEVLPQVITTTTSPPETLPFTGSSDTGAAGAGVALLALGGLTLLVARRREDETVVAKGEDRIS